MKRQQGGQGEDNEQARRVQRGDKERTRPGQRGGKAGAKSGQGEDKERTGKGKRADKEKTLTNRENFRTGQRGAEERTKMRRTTSALTDFFNAARLIYKHTVIPSVMEAHYSYSLRFKAMAAPQVPTA